MRSIVLRDVETRRLNVDGPFYAMQCDPATGYVYVLTDRGITYVKDGKSGLVPWEVPPEGVGLDMSLLDGDQLVCVYSSGDVRVVQVEGWHTTETNLPIQVTALSWHPDHSILAVTDNQSIFFVDRLFDVVAQNELSISVEGKEQLVTVGWGAEETQFQGSKGKMREKKEVEAASEDDDGRTHMEWRQDGQFVALNYLDTNTSRRSVSMWNTEGELLSRVNTVSCVEGGLAIRPIGNCIAIPVREGNKRVIEMYERNGEKRNGRIEEDREGTLMDMQWNAGGTILTLHLKLTDSHVLEVWTCSNNDWSRQVCVCVRSLSTWQWDEGRAIWAVVGDTSSLSVYTFSSIVHSSHSTVAVLSTECVRISDLSKALIPPPMSEYTIGVNGQIRAFSMCTHNMAIFISDRIQTYVRRDGCFVPSDSIQVHLQSGFLPLSFQWWSDRLLLLTSDGSASHLYEIVEERMKELCVVSRCSWLGVSPDGPLLLCSDGRCLAVSEKKDRELFRLADPNVDDIRCTDTGSVVSLSSGGCLCVNGVLIHSACSSFLVVPSGIFFMDSMSSLHHVSDGVDRDAPRNCEKGSRLISSFGSSVIFQMPRGNLEKMHSKYLLVEEVKVEVEEGRIEKALLLLRKHRLPMTIILDKWWSVICDCGSWMSSIVDVDLLCLFLANIGDHSRAASVCSYVGSAVLSLALTDRLRLFHVLLSSFLVVSPPDVSSAIHHIVQHSKLTKDASDALRDWIHYLSFFIQKHDIFKSALGSYDVSFAVLVMELLSLDPREHLPLLNELHQMENESRRRYRIDCLRGDFVSALRHLSLVEDSLSEAIQLIEEKELHVHALEIYKGRAEQKEILTLYATLCAKRADHETALLMARKACDVHLQLQALQALCRPRDYHDLAIRNGRDPREGLDQMKAKLQREQKWSEVAEVIQLLGGPIELAVDALSNAGQWHKAYELYSHNQIQGSYRLERVLAAAIDAMRRRAEEAGEQFRRYSDRLAVVRSNKLVDFEKVSDGRDIDACDAFSEASTMSTSSRASTVTRRKKQVERKKESLKEGGRYEDFALLRVLHTTLESIRVILSESDSLLQVAVLFDLFAESRSLHELLSSLSLEVNSRRDTVWPRHLEIHHLPGPLADLYTVDGVVVFPRERQMPPTIVLDAELCPPVAVSWRFPLFQ